MEEISPYPIQQIQILDGLCFIQDLVRVCILKQLVMLSRDTLPEEGTAGTFIVNQTTADRDAIGAFVVYNGSGTAGGGGGNAVEVQHNGTNGNAMDVFMGTPSILLDQQIQQVITQLCQLLTWEQVRLELQEIKVLFRLQ